MRDIKFRGKRADGGGWVYGYFVKHLDRGTWVTFIDTGRGVLFEVIPETVGQYTELPDKNGVEIYEGDIVRKDNKHIAEIIFKDGGFGTESTHYKQYQFGDVVVDYKSWHYIRNANTSIEIIGNIWDNPDLLKGVA